MSYNGQIAEIPVGMGGLTGSKNQNRIRPDQLITASNIAYDTGNITKEGGATKYNATAIAGTPRVVGGFDWWPTNGVQRMIIVGDNGNIYRDDGAGTFSTTLKTGLTTLNMFPFFLEGGAEASGSNRKLFLFTGTNKVQVLSGDGATMSNLATPPADWAASHPLCGAIHENRLWGAGNMNDPHRVYYSTPANHEDFTGTGSGSISVYPGEGERIVALMSFKGLLVAFKSPRGIYLIDTSDPSTGNWRSSRMTSAIGTVSPLSIVGIDDDLIFLDASGNFQLLSAVTEFGDMGNRNLSAESDMNTFMRSNINFAQIAKVQAVYYSHKREVHFGLPGVSSLYLNRRLVIDFNGQGPRFRFSDRDMNHAIWLRKDLNGILRVMIGEDGGFVYEIDRAVKTKDGNAYGATFQTAHMDMSWIDPILATKKKIGQFLEIVVEPTGDWDLAVDVLWDNKLTDTIHFNMGATGAKLGSFTLGTDKLGSGALLNRRKRINGEGHRLSLVARNSGQGQDFSISRFFLYFKMSDERTKE